MMASVKETNVKETHELSRRHRTARIELPYGNARSLAAQTARNSGEVEDVCNELVVRQTL
jgi:hypothetical protein